MIWQSGRLSESLSPPLEVPCAVRRLPQESSKTRGGGCDQSCTRSALGGEIRNGLVRSFHVDVMLH